MIKPYTFLYNKSEIGAGTRGASLGVEAIQMAAIVKGSSFFTKFPFLKINHKNQILPDPIKYQRAKRIDEIISIYEELSEKVSDTLLDNRMPILISGDHSSAGGTIAGIKKAYPDKRLGIIWIDAHADLHSPYTSPSGNIHGMPLAVTLGIDNEELVKVEVEQEVRMKWEKLKSIGGVSPKALPDDLVFIGVRDTEKEEDYLMEKLNIKNYTTAYLREIGIAKVIENIKENDLKNCDMIYVSFDVDSLDCDAVSYGTGTPVKNGLYEEEAKGILKMLVNWDKIVCLEVTEINPLLDDKKNKMAETALAILEYAFEGKN